MAFIFVPNADGGFDEGDKQTNPDTGVEYIYINGAWRALGPNIEGEFEKLDERYVNIDGDTITNTLTVDNTLGRPAFIAAADGDPNIAIYSDGKVESGAMLQGGVLRAITSSGSAVDVKPNNGDSNAQIKANGSAYFTKEIELYADPNVSHTGLTVWGTNKNGEIAPVLQSYHNVGTTNPDAVNYTGKMESNTNLVNKQYVDEQIAQVDPADNIIVPGFTRPPGLRFNYTDGSSVSAGQFAWYDNGGRRLRVSSKSYDVDWGTSSPTGDISYSESHLFHIWSTFTDSSTGEEKWRIKVTGSFNRMDWHANDILLFVAYSIPNGTFSPTAAYYITISGLF